MLLASYISWVDVESVWENGLSRKSERAPGSHGRLLKALPIVIHEKMLFMPISCVKSAACLVIFCCAQLVLLYSAAHNVNMILTVYLKF